MKKSNYVFFGLNVLILVFSLNHQTQADVKPENIKFKDVEVENLTIRDKNGKVRIFLGLANRIDQPSIVLSSEDGFTSAFVGSTSEGGEIYLNNHHPKQCATIHLATRKDFSRIALTQKERKDFTKDVMGGLYLGYDTERELTTISFKNFKDQELGSFGINAGKPLLEVLSKEKKFLRYPADWWPPEGK